MDNHLMTWMSDDRMQHLTAFTTLRHSIRACTSPRFTGPEGAITGENRKQLAHVLGIDARQLVFPLQTHSSNVEYIAEVPKHDPTNTDALITDVPGICICVQTADCVPLLMFDPVKNVAAVVHAGWRGTVGNIVRNVVHRLINIFSSSPNNLKIVIGPSIGPGKYEVGSEVAAAVKGSVPNPHLSLTLLPSGKHLLNLWEANRQLLLECDVPFENIIFSGCCTFSDPVHFFSARREGINTGRLVSGIMISKALSI